MILRYFLIFEFWIIFISVNAQKYSGNHLGNHAGIYGIQENPASFIHQKPKWDVNILGLGAFGYTEYGYIANESLLSLNGKSVLNGMDTLPTSYNPETNALFYANQYSKTLNGLMVQQTTHLPSFCFKIYPFSLGLFSNVRIAADALDAPNFFNYENLSEIVNYQQYSVSPFTVNSMLWGEIGLNIGYVKEMDNGHSISIGANPKYLLGFESFYVQNKSEYQFIRVDDTFFSSTAHMGFGFASGGSTTSNDYNFGVQGTGFGLDIGAEYIIPSENNDEDESPSRYDWRFGAAIKDIGSINFNNNTEQHNFSINNVEFGVLKTITDRKQHSYDVIKRLSAAVYNGDSTASLQSREMRIYTPTALTLYADHHIANDIYVNAYINQRLKTLEKQIASPNIMMLGARFEKRWFEAGATVSLTEGSWFGVGTYVRLGLLTIGSDHINAILLSQPKLRGADIYMSLKIMPFGNGSTKDKGIDYIGNGRGGKYGCFRMR